MTRQSGNAPLCLQSSTPRPDLYACVTDAIVADLERGVRPWTKPWSAQHLAGRITRPLRHNLQPTAA